MKVFGTILPFGPLLLASCAVPTSNTGKPANLGSIALVSVPGVADLKIERPASSKELFLSGTGTYFESIGTMSKDELVVSPPFAAFYVPALFASGVAGPLTGALNSVRGVSKQAGTEQQKQMRKNLSGVRWLERINQRLTAKAQAANHPLAAVKELSLESLEGNRNSICAWARSNGADTLAQVQMYGPSLVIIDGLTQRLQVRMAMRVEFVEAAAGKTKRIVWIESQSGPKRSPSYWAEHPEELIQQANRDIELAAETFAHKLSVVGGKGEVQSR